MGNFDDQLWGISAIAITVGVGGNSSCGIRPDGTLTCWGSDFTGFEERPAPSGSKFAMLSAGTYHWCGIRTNDTITCWGNNSSGQADAPEGRFTAVVGGVEHSCGLRSDGSVACWGKSWWLPPPLSVQEVRTAAGEEP